MGAHVVRGQNSETGIWSAGCVRQHGITREDAETVESPAERVDVIGVGADAGNYFDIAGLHGAQRAAQGDDAARAPERNVIEPANRNPEVLSEPNRGVGRQCEAAETQTVDRALARSESAMSRDNACATNQ